LETSMFLAVCVSDFMVRVMLPGYPGEEDFRVDFIWVVMLCPSVCGTLVCAV
jgi:hypothetical protein